MMGVRHVLPLHVEDKASRGLIAKKGFCAGKEFFQVCHCFVYFFHINVDYCNRMFFITFTLSKTVRLNKRALSKKKESIKIYEVFL